ncbi:MAG: VOC family protein [Chitinophagaceae bacterium]|nr:VOC family protein [Chitinophagaceae bacterium]MBK9939314.1 VOC family protein [Chitinophagaceae bacterium]
MSTINTYLTFNGNCREAMIFYKKCLGGELLLQTTGESPLAEKMRPQMKKIIVHATLIKGDLVLMGSDMVGEKGVLKGNAVSLMLNCDTEREIKKYYTRLSAGGHASNPLQISFWGALFGNLTDKFGNQWLLHFNKKQKPKGK